MNERIKLFEDQCFEYKAEMPDIWFNKEKFADLIRADEREACAKVCDDAAGTWNGWPQAKSALTAGAIAIRARKNT